MSDEQPVSNVGLRPRNERDPPAGDKLAKDEAQRGGQAHGAQGDRDVHEGVRDPLLVEEDKDRQGKEERAEQRHPQGHPRERQQQKPEERELADDQRDEVDVLRLDERGAIGQHKEGRPRQRKVEVEAPYASGASPQIIRAQLPGKEELEDPNAQSHVEGHKHAPQQEEACALRRLDPVLQVSPVP
ncbi:uncharacterized protein VTP21DRAFT_2490 [Calcarisporiella thermophila]|uniref:uncharacterized protein n=1 Tax=Calcarisporiella thermophila TaxID=911321 RepID=UPI00374260D9